MNGYVCFYDGKRWECYANSMFAAKEKAVAHFKPPKSKQHMVSVVLAEKDGKQVEHSGAAMTQFYVHYLGPVIYLCLRDENHPWYGYGIKRLDKEQT